MSDKTGIEWTDATWNCIRGCSRVSAGCMNCYAERQAIRQIGSGYAGLIKRTSHGPAWTGEITTLPRLLDQPLRWREPRRIFVNSMSDLFHESVPFGFVDDVFAVMALAPRHTFQILTKRPERMHKYLTSGAGVKDSFERGAVVKGRAWSMLGHMPKYKHEGITRRPWPLPNVWLGVSVEDQETANKRIPLLLQTPAAVRFVSYEPALGPVDFTDVPNTEDFAEGQRHLDALRGYAWECSGPEYIDTCSIGARIDWLIVGGESGPKARPCDVGWIRSTVDQCKAAGVACFVKQLGARPIFNVAVVAGSDPWHYKLDDRKGGDIEEWPEDLRVREFPR